MKLGGAGEDGDADPGLVDHHAGGRDRAARQHRVGRFTARQHQEKASAAHRGADRRAAAADDLDTPLLTVARLVVPPEAMNAMPPLCTVVLVAMPPEKTNSVPPAEYRAGGRPSC